MKLNKYKMEKLWRMGGFFVLLLVLIYVAEEVLQPKRTNFPWAVTSKIKGFYEKEKNSLDVVFIGSSHAFCTFNPYVFYKTAHIKSYVFASNEQPLWISYYYLKEVLKHQKPKVIVLETFYVSEWAEYKKPGVNRLNIDDIPFSWNKLQMTKDATEDFMFFDAFDFYNYHDRWKDLTFSDFYKGEYGKLHGFTPLYKKEPKTIEEFDVKAQPLPTKSGLYLNKIIELAKKENIDLLFAYAPYNINSSRQSHILKTAEIAEENNIPFINFTDSSLLQKINFDAEKDFEGGHTNVYGAEKVSTYLAHFLKQRYSFDSSRDFSEYVSMGERLEAYERLTQIRNFREYIDYLKNKDLYVLISDTDIDRRKLDQLKALGSEITLKKASRNYTAVFQPKMEIVNEKMDSLPIVQILPQSLSQAFHVQIESSKNRDGHNQKIIINYRNLLGDEKKQGLNMVVYDAYMKKVVDVAHFDVIQETN